MTCIGGDIEIGWINQAGEEYADFVHLYSHEQIADTSIMSFYKGSGTNVIASTTGNDGGCFQLRGYDETIGALSSEGVDGVVRNSAGGSSHSLLTLKPPAGETYSFAGVIEDGGGASLMLAMNGSGTQALAGPNTYSGGTTNLGGTLLVRNTAGSGTGSGPVHIGTGGAIGGSGTISDNVTVDGAIAAVIESDSVNETLTVNGASGVTLNSADITLRLADGYDPQPTQEWQLLDSPNGISGTIGTLPDGYACELRNGDTELWLLRIPQGSLFMVL